MKFRQVGLPKTGQEATIAPQLASKSDKYFESGALRSPGFVTGKQGIKVDLEKGSAEFQDGIFNGSFTLGGISTSIGTGDDIQTALDKLFDEGGGTLYLESGTYNLTDNIDIPSGVALIGASFDNTILDFGGGAYSVRMHGSNVYETGTASVSSGSTSVTGVGTAWTTAMIGQFIWIGSQAFTITNVTSGTALTISFAYPDSSVSGGTYSIATPCQTGIIKNLTIQNTSSNALSVQYGFTNNIELVNCYQANKGIYAKRAFALYAINTTIAGNAYGVDYNDCYSFTFSTSVVEGNYTGYGISMTNCGDGGLMNTGIYANTGNGISLTGCSDIDFYGFTTAGNGGKGIEFISGTNNIHISSFSCQSNTSDGIKLTATSDGNIISSGAILSNGGYGINIAASTCDTNTILAPYFASNSSGEVNDSGTGTIRIQQSDNSASTKDFIAG